MKDLLAKINPAFDHRNRLAIMALLTANILVEYITLKELLNLTDGNLATHLKGLESAGYITIQKRFVGRKPRTTYGATEQGREAFKVHLDALEALVQMAREGEE